MNKTNSIRSSDFNMRPEEELQELSLRYEAILAAVPDIIMEVDANKVYTWANQSGLVFFGEDVLGKEASFYFEGEQNTYERVHPLFEGDENVIYVESWQRRKDGKKRLLAWWCRILKDENGNVKGAISTARDITDQQETEEQIRLQNQLFENTIESLTHPFYVIDANDYRIIIANTATAIFGTISKDVTCYALTHNRKQPCRGTKHICPLEEVKKTKKPVTLEHTHYDKDGNARYIELHAYPIFDNKGNIVQMIESGLDITERKQMEEELRESKKRFRSVVRSAYDAIISVDSYGKITFWNRAAESIFGYAVYEIVGKSVSMIMPERFREKHQKGLNRVVSTGKLKIIGKTIEVVGLKKDGREFPVELSLAKWGTREGIFFTGILRDITERKRIEAEIQKANKRMKSDLEAAAEVQKSLLPKECLEIQEVRFAYTFKPCEELGGDIFNVFKLDEKHVGLYILDVSGHGVPAALLSVTLSHVMSPLPDQSSLLKQQIGNFSKYRLVPPAEVAKHLNNQFLMDPDKPQYFTLVYGILNLETHEFRYVSAGHSSLIYLSHDSDAAILYNPNPGLPIGFIKETNYEESSVYLKPGDRLYLYSDGVTDATNSNEEQFEERRLIGVLDQSYGLLLKDSISYLLKCVEEWCGDARPEDDISVLAIEIAEKTTSHIS
ncbi:MAG: hypothetical protein BA863_10170 [Desulfovibrio sp. S3730MH75]|nr:MAG: hypothetical protein BA863_10170 [Desulfovibrio sp. S3730MH75]